MSGWLHHRNQIALQNLLIQPQNRLIHFLQPIQSTSWRQVARVSSRRILGYLVDDFFGLVLRLLRDVLGLVFGFGCVMLGFVLDLGSHVLDFVLHLLERFLHRMVR